FLIIVLSNSVVLYGSNDTLGDFVLGCTNVTAQQSTGNFTNPISLVLDDDPEQSFVIVKNSGTAEVNKVFQFYDSAWFNLFTCDDLPDGSSLRIEYVDDEWQILDTDDEVLYFSEAQ